MAKKVPNSVLDALLDEIINNVDLMVMCAGEPADYTAATTLVSNGGNKLGDAAVASADFTKSDGDTSGRKLTTPQTAITADEGGDVDHIVLVDDTGTRLLHVTTIASFTVSGGTSYTIESYDEEIEDPA